MPDDRRQKKLEQRLRRADERQGTVEKRFGRPITMRETVKKTQLEEPVEFRPASADVDARTAIGLAASIDLDAVARLGESAPDSSWFDVASVCLPEYPPVLTDRDRVWFSAKGSLYHRWDDCETMWAGKLKAEKEGKEVHSVSSATVREAKTQDGYWGSPLTPCRTCI